MKLEKGTKERRKTPELSGKRGGQGKGKSKKKKKHTGITGAKPKGRYQTTIPKRKNRKVRHSE